MQETWVDAKPGGRLFQAHPLLGYRHLPGQFTVTLHNTYSFEVTHLDNTLRITSPVVQNTQQTERDEIWIFGCSFTHGWSLNDHETFPWLLQTELSEHEVVNFGVGGYATLQSLIQFREALNIGKKPVLAVLTYADIHDLRNTFSRIRRKQVAPHNKLGPLLQPFGRLNKNNDIVYAMADVLYREFPLMRHSAMVHQLEKVYNRLEARFLQCHEVSKRIMEDFCELATEQGVKVVIVGMTAHPLTRDILGYATEMGIPAVDISVNLGEKGYNNLPYDGHPSAKAHHSYAQSLAGFLRTQITDQIRHDQY